MGRNNEILVLGLGNEVLGDERLGIDVVKELEIRNQYPQIDYCFSSIGGLEILEFIQGYSKGVLIDTVESEDRIEGRVSVMNRDDYKETLHLSSPHDLNFKTTLSLGKKLGYHIPDQIMIIAIEIIPDLILTNRLSRNIQAGFMQILDEINIHLEQFVCESHPCSSNKEPQDEKV